MGSLVPILLLLGVGITSGLATAELTASQQVQPAMAAVGETATVTLTLTYNGGNTAQVTVTASLPGGVVTDQPGAQTASLYPGSSVPISYPIRAVQSGNYLITSLISYTEEGAPRELRMGSEFSATGGSTPTGTPAAQPSAPQTMPGSGPSTVPGPMGQEPGSMPGPSMPYNMTPTEPSSVPITPDYIPAPPQAGNDSSPAI